MAINFKYLMKLVKKGKYHIPEDGDIDFWSRNGCFVTLRVGKGNAGKILGKDTIIWGKKMEFKEYKEEEFEQWCEDHFVEDNFGIWGFIKNQEVNLGIDTDEHGEKSTLIVRVKLTE